MNCQTMDLNEIPFHPLIKVHETSAFRLFINHSHSTIVCLDQDFTYKVGTKEEWRVRTVHIYIRVTYILFTGLNSGWFKQDKTRRLTRSIDLNWLKFYSRIVCFYMLHIIYKTCTRLLHLPTIFGVIIFSKL